MVIEEEARADHPGRPLLRRMGQDEAHRPDDVRSRREQHLALDQGLPHEAELVVFEISQAAMDELAGARGGALGEVVLLAEQDAEAAADGIAGDPRAVDAATDDDQVVLSEMLHG
jgi:hypothetical protein